MDNLVAYAFDQANAFSGVGSSRLRKVCREGEGQTVSDIRQLWQWASEESRRMVPHLDGQFLAVELSELLSDEWWDAPQNERRKRMILYASALAVIMQQSRQWCELDTKCLN